MNPLRHFIKSDTRSKNQMTDKKCPKCKSPLMWDLESGVVSTPDGESQYLQETPVLVCTNNNCNYQRRTL